MSRNSGKIADKPLRFQILEMFVISLYLYYLFQTLSNVGTWSVWFFPDVPTLVYPATHIFLVALTSLGQGVSIYYLNIST